MRRSHAVWLLVLTVMVLLDGCGGQGPPAGRGPQGDEASAADPAAARLAVRIPNMRMRLGIT
jgi:hypothetical protein